MSLKKGFDLYQKHLYREAYSVFQEVDIDPAEDAELSYFLGLCCVRLGQEEEAMNYFYLSIAVDMNLVRIYQSRMVIAYLNILKKRFMDARRQINRVVSDGYSSPQIHLLLGYILMEEDHLPESLDEYKKALRLDPNNHTALNNVGFMMAESGSQADQAVELCRRAVLLSPESPVYLDSLGWAFYKSGDFNNARSFLNKAKNIFPKNEIISYHLTQLE